MNWGGKVVYQTWFSGDVEAIRGINLLPMTAASMYHGFNTTYDTNYMTQLIKGRSVFNST
jgi:endoglucanase Acf2